MGRHLEEYEYTDRSTWHVYVSPCVQCYIFLWQTTSFCLHRKRRVEKTARNGIKKSMKSSVYLQKLNVNASVAITQHVLCLITTGALKVAGYPLSHGETMKQYSSWAA